MQERSEIPGKIPVDVEYENTKQKMDILIIERTDITPLLAMDWMKKFKPTIGKIQLPGNNQSEREKIYTKFPDLFENNEAIKDAEKNIQLKPRQYPVKQKTRPVPLPLKEDVGRELEKLIKTGHLEKINDVDEDCFVSPTVITVKIDKSQNETTHAKHGGINKSDFGRNYPRPNSTTFHIKNRFRLRIQTDETIRKDKPTMRIRNNRGKISRILPI